ncbi:GntR family transcriptional regulator [Streptosporangium amethystogenes subsp. fukuiense]|uniref:GntR family transcriptional regulator n=1 Tax=Streptosporangium TaxID=2000 RepID=UPI0031CFBDDA
MPSQPATRSVQRTQRSALVRELLERFPADSKLPPEVTLASELGVSRNTLREALEELRVRGLVVRRWGIGTFMAKRPEQIEYTLSDLVSVETLLTAAGRVCRIVEQPHGKVPADDDVATALHVPRKSEVWKTDRLYFADEIPVVWVHEFLPTLLDGVSIDPRGVGDDIQAYFAQQLGIPLSHADAYLEPLVPDERTSELLDVDSSTLVVRTWQTIYTVRGHTAVYAVATFRPDILHIKFQRRPPVL